MSWGNPWAWLGLIGLAVPLLIHMLGRRQAKTLPFPTLRFLDASRLQPVRRTRVQDLALLAIRLAVLLFAVAALAQPRLGSGRQNVTANTLARVIVVDTSVSMRRVATNARLASPGNRETAAEAARREARSLAEEAGSSMVVETAMPAAELSGANAWLSAQPGPGEIIVLSDFQAGTVDATAIAAVAAEFGIDLRRLEVQATELPVVTTARTGDIETVAHATPVADELIVQWTFQPAPAIVLDGLSLLADESETDTARDVVEAAWRALSDVRFGADRPVAIVYDEFDGRAELLRVARAPNAPWMTQTIRRIRDDALFLSAATEPADPTSNPDVALSPDGPFVRVGDAASDGTVAASAVLGGRDHLVFFTSAASASLRSAALIGAVGRALADRSPVAEREPGVISDSSLASLRRAPAVRASAVEDDRTSDGRWLWLAALVLLAVETLHRRRADTARSGARSLS